MRLALRRFISNLVTVTSMSWSNLKPVTTSFLRPRQYRPTAHNDMFSALTQRIATSKLTLDDEHLGMAENGRE